MLNICFLQSTTHLIVGPKASKTEKVLLAVTRGIPIVPLAAARNALLKGSPPADKDDVAAGGQVSFTLEPLEARRRHREQGGKLRGWRVLLLLTDGQRRAIFEK